MTRAPIEQITVTNDRIMGERREHPAMGCITIGRPTGGQNTFFGSDIQHQSYISLTINTAVEYYDTGWKRHHQNEQIIEVHMTADQWARMVSAIGIGSGTPCTLHWSRENGGYYPKMPPPEIGEEQKRTIGESGQRAIAAANAMVTEIETLLANGKISKKAADTLLSQARASINVITGTMPFVVEQAHEHIEKVVVDAKATVEAHMRQIVWDAGIQKLSETGALPVPQIENKGE